MIKGLSLRFLATTFLIGSSYAEFISVEEFESITSQRPSKAIYDLYNMPMSNEEQAASISMIDAGKYFRAFESFVQTIMDEGDRSDQEMLSVLIAYKLGGTAYETIYKMALLGYRFEKLPIRNYSQQHRSVYQPLRQNSFEKEFYTLPKDHEAPFITNNDDNLSVKSHESDNGFIDEENTLEKENPFYDSSLEEASNLTQERKTKNEEAFDKSVIDDAKKGQAKDIKDFLEKHLFNKKFSKFKVGDVFRSKDLGFELKPSYSGNRGNRFKTEGSKLSVSNHVILECVDMEIHCGGKEDYTQFKFHIKPNDENMQSQDCGFIIIKLPHIDSPHSLLEKKNIIYIESIKSDPGYGLAALQTLIGLFENNKDLYPDRKYFSLVDNNSVKNKDGKRIAINNLYQKLGFASHKSAPEYFLFRPRFLMGYRDNSWERDGTIKKGNKVYYKSKYHGDKLEQENLR